MKVYFHPMFYEEYTSDPAAESGRMEAIVSEIESHVEFLDCQPATEEQILAAHTPEHIEKIHQQGLYEIASLAAGGALQAATTGLKEPSFGLVRPPGHHASANSCWGFCYFNNMAISLYGLRASHGISEIFVLDFDLHFGDGNVNILEHETWIEIINPESLNRERYLDRVKSCLLATRADVIAVSAGFDNHLNDWGGLLHTDDYRRMGNWVSEAAQRNSGGCYGILEGGYNHNVLGRNVLAFLRGLEGEAGQD
ncbi:MAG: hypothetical protein QNJ17_07115 [Desulfocapsaceae bacterium]|nr:hypothetical protein [Desulfocapsaceae bacterium]